MNSNVEIILIRSGASWLIKRSSPNQTRIQELELLKSRFLYLEYWSCTKKKSSKNFNLHSHRWSVVYCIWEMLIYLIEQWYFVDCLLDRSRVWNEDLSPIELMVWQVDFHLAMNYLLNERKIKISIFY